MKGLKQLQRGFTLMELMVVIVIVAILAAVAVPLYINYVNDARDTEAKGAIGAIVTAEQTFKQSNVANSYTNDLTQLNVDLTEARTNWDFQIPSASDSTFQVKADGKTGQPTFGRHVFYTYHRTDGLDPWTAF